MSSIRATLASTALALLALLCTASPVLADDGPERRKELEVKAALVFKFLPYMKWPKGTFEESNSPIVVGVLKSGEAGAIFKKTLSKKKVGKRRVRVVELGPKDDPSRCHLIFVPAKRVKELPALHARLVGKHVPLVGESKDFAIRGGVLNFYIEKRKTRFEINVDEMKRSKVEISSKLLKLARIVRDPKEEQE